MKDSAKKDTSSIKKDTSSVKMPVDKDASDFAVEASDAGLGESFMGKLAFSNAINQRIKNFGEMMMDDHTKVGDKLNVITRQKGIIVPDKLSDKREKRLLNI